jgi:hypothetical protein
MMSYLRLNYIGKSSLRLVIRENEKKGPAYITKYQYQSKIRQKPSSTPPKDNRDRRGMHTSECIHRDGVQTFYVLPNTYYERMDAKN